MPCWKQYLMLLIGSGMIVACNAASITWMALMEPLQNNVCLLSWAIACPIALVLHRSLRSLARHARRRRAVQRGKKAGADVVKQIREAFTEGRDYIGGVGGALHKPELMRKQSAATGLAQYWDGKPKTSEEEDEEALKKKKKNRNSAGLGGMMSMRGGGGGRGRDGTDTTKSGMDRDMESIREKTTSKKMKKEKSWGSKGSAPGIDGERAGMAAAVSEVSSAETLASVEESSRVESSCVDESVTAASGAGGAHLDSTAVRV